MKTHHFGWKAHSFTQALPMPCRRHIIFYTFQKMNFPGKLFFLASTPSERCPACACSCLQPQRILQPNIDIPQGRVLQGTNPKPILPVPERSCTMAAGSVHSRHCLQKLQECWLLRTEFLRDSQRWLWTRVQRWDPDTHTKRSGAASAALLITNNLQRSKFPQVSTRYWPGIVWLRIALNTSLAQLLPAPLITTSVFFHVSILAVLNYIAPNTEVAHHLTVLLVCLLLCLTCIGNFSSSFRIKQNIQKLLKTSLSHTNCLPPRSHPTW